MECLQKRKKKYSLLPSTCVVMGSYLRLDNDPFQYSKPEEKFKKYKTESHNNITHEFFLSSTKYEWAPIYDFTSAIKNYTFLQLPVSL